MRGKNLAGLGFFIALNIYTIDYRIFAFMKVTALLEDNLIQDLIALTGGKNITESLRIALKDWIRKEKLKNIANDIKQNPLSLAADTKASYIRDLNRK